ncbi:MAG: hypothetical protein QG639_624, partial [Patescibacteria group bacterium]|nr:hypothetical protein [Patescibacteria group bacterium]
MFNIKLKHMMVHHWFKRCFLSLAVFTLFFSVSSTAFAKVEVIRDPGTQRVVALETSALSLQAISSSVAGNASLALSHREIADRFIYQNLSVMGITNPATELIPSSSVTDQLGMSHIRYEQKHLGVPVFGGEMILHVSPYNEVTFATMSLADG